MTTMVANQSSAFSTPSSKSSSPSPARSLASSGSGRNVQPVKYNHARSRSRQLPVVEDLKVAPYKPIKKSFLSLVWYKLHVETSAILLDPWERVVSALITLTVLCSGLYLAQEAFAWLSELAKAELVS